MYGDFNAIEKWAITSAHEPSTEVAFVVCMKCGAESSVTAGGRDDTELKKYFESKGWTVKPTRCPKCKDKV